MLEIFHYDSSESISQDNTTKSNITKPHPEQKKQKDIPFDLKWIDLNNIYSFLESTSVDRLMKHGLKTNISITDKNRDGLNVIIAWTETGLNGQEFNHSWWYALYYDIWSHNQKQTIKLYELLANNTISTKKIRLESNRTNGPHIECRTYEEVISLANLKNYLLTNRKQYKNPSITYEQWTGILCTSWEFPYKKGILSEQKIYERYPLLKQELSRTSFIDELQYLLSHE